MGEAKKRGSLEQRKQEAIANEPKPLSEEVKQEMRDHIKMLGKKEEDAARQLIPAYIRYTRMYDRILNSAATKAELDNQ